MFITGCNRYALSFAMLVLGLSGCSSPQKSPNAAQNPKIDSISSSTTKLEQDFSQTESDFSKLESQVQSKK